PPLPKPAAASVPASAPAPRPPRADLEQFVGLKVIGRIGIAAVVLAAIWFGKLGWDEIGPIGRIACIYGLAAIALATGFALRPHVRPSYTALLFGGAVTLSYAATITARLGYGLLDATPALALLVASTALGQWLGWLLRLETLATVALGGGYAAPVLVGDPAATPTFLLGYLLVLHTWAAWAQYRFAWHWARGLAVVGTVSILSAWFGTRPLPSDTSLVLHVEVALLGLTAPELIAAFRGPVPRLRWVLALIGLWVAQLQLVGVSLPSQQVGSFGLVAGSGWLLTAVALARRPGARPRAAHLARIGGVLAAFGAVTVWNPMAELVRDPVNEFGLRLENLTTLRLPSLVVTAAALFALRRLVTAADLAMAIAAVLAVLVVFADPDRTAARPFAPLALAIPTALVWLGGSRTGACAGLAIGALGTFVLPSSRLGFDPDRELWTAVAFVVTGAWLAGGAIASRVRQHRALHATSAILLTLACCAWIFVAIQSGFVDEDHRLLANWRFGAALPLLAAAAIAHRWRPAGVEPAAIAIGPVAALAVAYLAGLAEVRTAVLGLAFGWREAATSLYSMTFAGIVLATGFVRRSPPVRWFGLVGLLVVVLKVALIDVAELETSMRVLVTGVLGVVLMVGAWGYARFR
ncbi:MAG: DUF2339 domain-containing protein, partial [Planctomycetes bacterium]|nr:DUF2339 domain-containing protein [Planctomycetota bacterium]